MECILMDVDATSEISGSQNIVILVVVALFAIVAITAVFIWRKNKNKNQ